MTNKFFIPTKQDIENVEVGSLAPDFTGQLKEVVEVTAKEPAMNGKWFVCYYVKSDNDDNKEYYSLREDELDLSLSLCNEYTIYELDDIETEILNARSK